MKEKYITEVLLGKKPILFMETAFYDVLVCIIGICMGLILPSGISELSFVSRIFISLPFTWWKLLF